MALSSIFTKLAKSLKPSGNNEKEVEFHGQFSVDNDTLNGLCLGGIYLPEEIVLSIFTYLNYGDILSCSLVCKRWCNIAKSNILWQTIYNEVEHPKKAKNLPWYVFYCYFTSKGYFTNVVKNGNGQKKYKHWTVVSNGGDKFRIEDPPAGSDQLPEGIPDFNGFTSCFATSYQNCAKYQKIDLSRNKLLKYIIKKYRPTLYASEWYAARFDCASVYKLVLICETKHNKCNLEQEADEFMHFGHLENDPMNGENATPYYSKFRKGKMEQWEGKSWQKMEITSNEYPASEVEAIVFYHEGQDCQFWAGHYGSKMAGGVMKFMFESIEPTAEDIGDTEEVFQN